MGTVQQEKEGGFRGRGSHWARAIFSYFVYSCIKFFLIQEEYFQRLATNTFCNLFVSWDFSCSFSLILSTFCDVWPWMHIQ